MRYVRYTIVGRSPYVMSKGACGGASPGAASHRRLKAACLSRGPSKHVCHRSTAAVDWRWRGRACVPSPRRVVSPAGGPCSPAARTRIDTACQPLHRGSGPPHATRYPRRPRRSRSPSVARFRMSLHATPWKSRHSGWNIRFPCPYWHFRVPC